MKIGRKLLVIVFAIVVGANVNHVSDWVAQVDGFSSSTNELSALSLNESNLLSENFPTDLARDTTRPFEGFSRTHADISSRSLAGGISIASATKQELDQGSRRVCCQAGDRFFATTRNTCVDNSFRVTAPERCEAETGSRRVCCQAGNRLFSTTRSTCLSNSYLVIAPERCEAGILSQRVCCQAGSRFFTTTRRACTSSSYRVTTPVHCEAATGSRRVCCQAGDRLFSTTRSTCLNNSYLVIAPERCEAIEDAERPNEVVPARRGTPDDGERHD